MIFICLEMILQQEQQQKKMKITRTWMFFGEKKSDTEFDRIQQTATTTTKSWRVLYDSIYETTYYSHIDDDNDNNV